MTPARARPPYVIHQAAEQQGISGWGQTEREDGIGGLQDECGVEYYQGDEEMYEGILRTVTGRARAKDVLGLRQKTASATLPNSIHVWIPGSVVVARLEYSQ